MKEYLDEKEAQISRAITNITDTLPSSVAAFAHSLEYDNIKSIASIYQYILDIRLFYSVLAEQWEIDPKDIDDKKLYKVTPEIIKSYVNALYKPNRITAGLTSPDQKRKDKRYKSLWYYFDYLERTGFLDENIMQKPEDKRKGKPAKPMVIKSPEDVSFKMNGWTKTTVDGKYSIIKEKDPNGGYGKYRFYVRDEERNVLFTDDKGETLYLNGNEARDFVKRLYVNLKKERHK